MLKLCEGQVLEVLAEHRDESIGLDVVDPPVMGLLLLPLRSLDQVLGVGISPHLDEDLQHLGEPLVLDLERLLLLEILIEDCLVLR